MAIEELGLAVAVEGFRKFVSQMDKMDRKIGATGTAWEGMGKKASPLTGILKTVAKVGIGAIVSAAVLAVTAVGALALGLGKLAVSSVGVAADFQAQMAVLQIAASNTGLTYDELHDAALQVGGDTRLLGVSASGAADSMTGLYKAGLTTTEIFGDLNGYLAGTTELGGALRASIDLAAASELDMVQASDLAAIALATFGGEMETEEERAQFVTDAMNNLVQAADASVADVGDLAAALTNVGPVAAQFGFSLMDTNNALAILSTRGIKGAEAGTALRSMFTNIMRPTDKVQEALNELNVSLYDTEGNMLGLPDIIGQFEGAMVGLTEEQRNQYVQTLAGTYGMKAFNTLIQEGVEGWDDMAEATGNAMGIQEQAAIRAETYHGKMEALEGVIETLKIGIGEALLPTLIELATWFAEMTTQYGPQLQAMFESLGVWIQTVAVPAFMELAAWLQTNIPVAIETLSAFWTTSLLPAIKQVTDFWANTLQPILAETVDYFAAVLIPAFAELCTWLQEVIPPAIDFIVEHWQIFAAIAAVVVAIIVAMTAPLLLVAAAVVALAVAWATNWNGIRDKTMAAVEAVRAVIQTFLLAVQTWWSEHGENVMLILTTIWEGITGCVQASLARLQAIIDVALAVIRGFWSTHGEAITTVLTNTWNMIKNLARIGMEYVSNIIDMIAAVIRGDWKAFGEELKANWKLIWEAIKTVASTLGQNLVTIIEDIVQSIIDAFTSVDWGEIGSTVIGGIADGIESAIGGIVSAAQGAVSAVTGVLSGIGGTPTDYSPAYMDLPGGFQHGTPFVPRTGSAFLHRGEAVLPAAAAAAYRSSIANSSVTNNYNLTTKSTTRPGGLAMEFGAMQFQGAGATR